MLTVASNRRLVGVKHYRAPGNEAWGPRWPSCKQLQGPTVTYLRHRSHRSRVFPEVSSWCSSYTVFCSKAASRSLALRERMDITACLLYLSCSFYLPRLGELVPAPCLPHTSLPP